MLARSVTLLCRDAVLLGQAEWHLMFVGGRRWHLRETLAMSPRRAVTVVQQSRGQRGMQLLQKVIFISVCLVGTLVDVTSQT